MKNETAQEHKNERNANIGNMHKITRMKLFQNEDNMQKKGKVEIYSKQRGFV
jgi:hypothetical protein